MSASTLTRLLGECIAIDDVTPPGDGARVCRWIEDWVREFGATVVRDVVWDGADNLLATCSFGPGPTVVLNSHMDVVDVADQTWESPPFTAMEREGRIVGRGSVDAKSSLVAMIAAMERLAENPVGLTGSVLLTAVVAEEAGGLGSRHLCRDGFAADAAIVGEPTNLDVAYAHKGTYMRELTFVGKAAHSASPWLGINAAVHAAHFVQACVRETERLARNPHPALGPATLTPTKVHSGQMQNTVPSEATVLIDRRLIPGETHADCDAQLAHLLEDLVHAHPEVRVRDIRTVVATVPSETKPTHPIVRSALRAVRTVRGRHCDPSGFNAGCDMSKLAGLGIPTIICGPGSLSHAHAANESVLRADYLAAIDIYEAILRDLLREEGPLCRGNT